MTALRSAAFAAALLIAAGATQGADDTAWPVAGRQGIMRFVIVPVAEASHREAYVKQIERLCAGEETCFVNFYSNSSGAALAVPLPDAIANEATAVLRRSAKQGTEGFLFACRLKTADPDCF